MNSAGTIPPGLIYWVRCEDCSAEINAPEYSENAAIKAWNRRQGHDAIPVDFVRTMMLHSAPDESKSAWRVLKAWEEASE